MNCIIIDDELPARELMADNIAQVPFLSLVASAKSATEAIELLSQHQIDLIFLDIQMPGLTGLEFLRNVVNPPMVILVTAFQQHALDGFELDVVDYLIKPVPFARFLKAVQKAKNRLKVSKNLPIEAIQEDAYVFVNANYSLVKVMLRDVTYIEGLKDYVRINLTYGNTIVTRLGLKAIEERLDSSKFMRVHKSFMIALDKIDSVQKAQLVIQRKEIPIGDGYRSLLQNYISKKNL
ncbi:response regulator transcription factor [Pedobacter frigidisoli]|uniref:Response regulator transcription factor n=1 Tax=Pedobacter frigidisoli TaxID=2530455 RepID=A0A4R0NVP9_9SPHI|nr:LytTR family DNA-binding domain-containing protein [Pedobacter frigidisoli]TCD05583.1 response regulator transcription factor [Pedobacter frigidisoli]